MKKSIMARFAKMEGYNHQRDGIKIPQPPKACHSVNAALSELKESGETHVDVIILEALKQELDEMISDNDQLVYFTEHVVGTTYFVFTSTIMGAVEN